MRILSVSIESADLDSVLCSSHFHPLHISIADHRESGIRDATVRLCNSPSVDMATKHGIESGFIERRYKDIAHLGSSVPSLAFRRYMAECDTHLGIPAFLGSDHFLEPSALTLDIRLGSHDAAIFYV